ncbi:MAG: hypothetical protein O2897_00705 [bacterium]|nr:hypothetical protein [bacterium]
MKSQQQFKKSKKRKSNTERTQGEVILNLSLHIKHLEETIRDMKKAWEMIVDKYEDRIEQIEKISNHNYETANNNAEVAQENAKSYYEMTRAYNSLCQFGKLAEELGIDIKKHNAELPENKYKNWKFDIGQKVSETGKVTSYMSLTDPKAKKKKEAK